MSYIQIEIGGKLRDMVFTQGVNILIRDKFLAFDKDERLAFGMQLTAWAALKVNCILKGIPCDFTFEDVYNWYESLPLESVEKIGQAYNEMIAFEKDLPEQPEEKKSLTEHTEPSVTQSDAAS